VLGVGGGLERLFQSRLNAKGQGGVLWGDHALPRAIQRMYCIVDLLCSTSAEGVKPPGGGGLI
jgi:hypothetical protein